jgi:hypothetical protein
VGIKERQTPLEDAPTTAPELDRCIDCGRTPAGRNLSRAKDDNDQWIRGWPSVLGHGLAGTAVRKERTAPGMIRGGTAARGGAGAGTDARDGWGTLGEGGRRHRLRDRAGDGGGLRRRGQTALLPRRLACRHRRGLLLRPDARPALPPAVVADGGAQDQERVEVGGGPMLSGALEAGADDDLVAALHDAAAKEIAGLPKGRIADLVGPLLEEGHLTRQPLLGREPLWPGHLDQRGT